MRFGARQQVAEEIFQKMQLDSKKSISYIYKDCLRFLLNKFGNMSYYDGKGDAIKIKCYHANPERAVGIIFKESTIVLPVVTVSENSTKSNEEKRRYESVLVNESYWHPKYQRAVRIVSLPPRPITISYSLNIWSFYKNDLDQVREMIFSMFNPDLNVTIGENFYTKIFIESEDDASELKVQDQEDRLLQKTINLTLETAVPAPKFLYTSTGKIEKVKFEIDTATGVITPESLAQLDALVQADITEIEITLGQGKPTTGAPIDHTHEEYVTPEELQSMTWLTN